jgi:broad specificity phosphatase PhoE
MLRLPPHEGATRLVLVRHVAPSESMKGRVYGALDVPLSPEARSQAERLAEALEGVDLAAVYASPLRRALETAVPIAERQGLTPQIHDDLREIDFGELEGERYEDLERRRPELFRSWMEWMDHPTGVTFPGGESFVELRTRALTAAEEIRERHHGSSAAVVAHGGVTRAILAASLDLPDHALFRLDQPYGAVSVVDWFDGTPVVRLLAARPV